MKRNTRKEIDRHNPEHTGDSIKNTPKSPLIFSQPSPSNLWCIVTSSNRRNSREDITSFREESKKHGVRLIIVELAYDNVFTLKKTDAEVVVQINRGEKKTALREEELFHIGLTHVPSVCRDVMWVNGDDVFVHKQSTKTARTWKVAYFKIKKDGKNIWEKIMLFLSKRKDIIEYLANVFNITQLDIKLRLASIIKLKIQIRDVLFLDVRDKYINFLGLVGRQMKAKSPQIYFRLKKYFPDR